jgi:hypothetical protein
MRYCRGTGPRTRSVGEEYRSEYRVVSASCSSLYLRALRLRLSCRHFQPAAFACRRLAKTFNPKVAGSIPARPTPETCLFSVWVAARPGSLWLLTLAEEKRFVRTLTSDSKREESPHLRARGGGNVSRTKKVVVRGILRAGRIGGPRLSARTERESAARLQAWRLLVLGYALLDDIDADVGCARVTPGQLPQDACPSTAGA